MFKWLYGSVLYAKADRLGTYAAALAYCFVLSLIPFLVVTFTLGSQLAPRQLDLANAYKDLLTNILPNITVDNSSPQMAVSHEQITRVASLSSQIITTLRSSSHHGLATVGFILAVYTSFNLMNQIVRTLLFIFDDPRKPQEWTLVMILKTIALGVIWMCLLFLISIVSVITPVIHSVLDQFHLDSSLWTAPLLITRDMALMAALFGAFFLTYYLVPSKRYKLSLIRNGSLVASCGWLLCSLIFAYVLPNMWRSNAVYEALGSIVVILIWAQACAWSVIVGACWIVRFASSSR